MPSKSLTLRDVNLEHVYHFIDQGDPDNAPEGVVEYLHLIEKIRAMSKRRDKHGSRDAIIKHLVKVDGMTRHLAAKAHDDMVEYFYHERNVSRDAWRHLIAERMMDTMTAAERLAEDTNDLMKVVTGLEKLGKMLRLDQPDPIELEEDELKPWNIYTLDPEDIGMPKTSRSVLSKQIDELPELNEKIKLHIKQQSMILPPKLFVEPNEDIYED